MQERCLFWVFILLLIHLAALGWVFFFFFSKAVAIFGNLPPQLLFNLWFRVCYTDDLCEDIFFPIYNAIGNAKFLTMREADGYPGLNKIQVPPYWFPREHQGLLLSGASLTIEDWIFAHIGPSLNPISQPCEGPLYSAPFSWVWGGDRLVAGDVGMGDPVLLPALVSGQPALGCWLSCTCFPTLMMSGVGGDFP